uniref:Uncharacterized protein n=1 Tax=Ciona savignyi TaxID=51511 RepID=H2YXK8_CIOSA
MSDNPNVTVFSPYELKMRGLTHNVSCSIGEGGRALLTKEPAIASLGDVCSEDRIFGTQLNGQTVGKALKSAKFKDDVFLGMGEDSFRSMLKQEAFRNDGRFGKRTMSFTVSRTSVLGNGPRLATSTTSNPPTITSLYEPCTNHCAVNG